MKSSIGMSNLLRSFEFEDYIKPGTCAFFTLRTSEQNPISSTERGRDTTSPVCDNAFEYD